MANYVSNTIKVIGNEKDLARFKNDLFGEDKSDFSFKKISYNSDDVHDYSDLNIHKWDIRNGCRQCDCLNVKIMEFKTLLILIYATQWDSPDLIYQDLIENYKNLDFKISAHAETNDWAIDIATSGGEYIKYYHIEWDVDHLTKNFYIKSEYVKDLLNDNKITTTHTYVFKVEEETSSSTDIPASIKSNSENTSAAIVFDDLDDDSLIHELEKIL